MVDYYLYTDGGSRGNPGPAGAGAVLSDAKNKVLKKSIKNLGVLTNNEAEYLAVIEGLQLAKKTLGQDKVKASQIELRLDSELVAKQLQGEYQIKEDHLALLFVKVWNLRIKYFPHLTIRPIPRAENKLADAAANLAMDEAEVKPNRLL